MSIKNRFECIECGGRNTKPITEGIHYCNDCQDYFEEDDHETFTRKRRWEYDEEED